MTSPGPAEAGIDTVILVLPSVALTLETLIGSSLLLGVGDVGLARVNHTWLLFVVKFVP